MLGRREHYHGKPGGEVESGSGNGQLARRLSIPKDDEDGKNRELQGGQREGCYLQRSAVWDVGKGARMLTYDLDKTKAQTSHNLRLRDQVGQSC